MTTSTILTVKPYELGARVRSLIIIDYDFSFNDPCRPRLYQRTAIFTMAEEHWYNYQRRRCLSVVNVCLLRWIGLSYNVLIRELSMDGKKPQNVDLH